MQGRSPGGQLDLQVGAWASLNPGLNGVMLFPLPRTHFPQSLHPTYTLLSLQVSAWKTPPPGSPSGCPPCLCIPHYSEEHALPSPPAPGGARKGGTPPSPSCCVPAPSQNPGPVCYRNSVSGFLTMTRPAPSGAPGPPWSPLGHPLPGTQSPAVLQEPNTQRPFQKPRKKAKTEETSEALVYFDGAYFTDAGFRCAPHPSRCEQVCSSQGRYTVYSELFIQGAPRAGLTLPRTGMN